MRRSTIFLLLVVPFTALHCQNRKQQIQRLQTENDSLRVELQKCQTGPFQRITESLESPKFGENPKYSRVELQAKLLPQIKLKSNEKYVVALNTIDSTDQFLEYCDAIKAALIQRTGGLDPRTGQPVGIRDNKATTQFFIEEKRGEEFKSKIDELRGRFLKTIQNDLYFTPRIVLMVEPLPVETNAKSWEEFKFKSMPLAAVLPILGKYESDAKGSEAAVLQYLNE